MAIAHLNTQSASVTTGGVATVTVTKPTGTVDGSLLFAICYGQGSGSPTWSAPSGWTAIDAIAGGSTSAYATFYKVASGEGANFTFTQSVGLTAGSALLAIVSAFSGVATTSPLDVHAAADNAASTVLCAPSVTTTQANDLLIFSVGQNTGTGITPPSGMTEPTNGDPTAASRGLEVAYLLDAGAAGATGDKSGSSATSSANRCFLAAFKIAVTATTVALPTATATAAAAAPTPLVVALPPKATATAAAPVPTLRIVALPPTATATAAAPAPTILLGPILVACPVATATATALVPTPRIVSLPPTATATAVAAIPTLTVVTLLPTALATSQEPLPTVRLVALLPAALAIGQARVPTVLFAIGLPTAQAVAQARTPTIAPMAIPVPTARAVAQALLPAVLAYQRFVLYGRAKLIPAVSFDLTGETPVSFDLTGGTPVSLDLTGETPVSFSLEIVPTERTIFAVGAS